jgi:DnaD/phage-associated family protein
MKKRFWIKLTLDILDDIKLGPLQEFMKWRAIELYLVAGENGNDGLLPPVERLAWRLRLPREKLEETLSVLSQAGVVHETPQGWVVTDFARSQAPMTSTERSQYTRRRQNDAAIRSNTGSENAAVVAADSSSTSASLSGSESLEGEGVQGEGKPRLLPETVPGGAEPPVDIFRAYQQNIGVLTPMITEALREAEIADGAEWVCAAIDEAVKNNARSWKYCRAILERWRRDGFRSDTRLTEKGGRSSPGRGISSDQLQSWVQAREKERSK